MTNNEIFHKWSDLTHGKSKPNLYDYEGLLNFAEFYHTEQLILHSVSKCADYIIDYIDSDGSEAKMVATAISFDEAIYIFNGDYGLEMTGIRKV